MDATCGMCSCTLCLLVRALLNACMCVLVCVYVSARARACVCACVHLYVVLCTCTLVGWMVSLTPNLSVCRDDRSAKRF